MGQKWACTGQGVDLGAAAGDVGTGRADDEQRLIGELGREVFRVQVEDRVQGVDPADAAAGAAGPDGGMVAVADLGRSRLALVLALAAALVVMVVFLCQAGWRMAAMLPIALLF